MSSIRAKVVCLLRNGDRILLLHITDPHDGRRFLIPPGGGVEFGETLEQAVVREIAEEVGLRIASPRRLGMFENIFRYNDKPEHELVFVYEAECDDAELCAQGEVVVTESNGERQPARWLTPADIKASGPPLFPFGLLDSLCADHFDVGRRVAMLILVTGASGSGTSTLGAALAAELKFAFLEIDHYYWQPTTPPFTTKRDGVERLAMLLRDVRAESNAVLAGSILEWGRELEDAFDLIVFLYLDTAIRVERLRERETERRGFADVKFLDWAAQYDAGPPSGRSLAKHQAWLAARSCPLIELRGDLSVEARVAAVLRYCYGRRGVPTKS